MYDTLERLEAGTSAYRKWRRRRLNRTPAVESNDGSDTDATYNLADAVPNDAWELWQCMPEDPRELFDPDQIVRAWESSDDLGTVIYNAVRDGKLVDLGSGNYEMDEQIKIAGELFAVVGDGSDQATITWNGPRPEKLDEYPTFDDEGINRNGPGLLFSTQGGTLAKGYLYGVTVDIEGETEPGYKRDAGILRAEVTDKLWVDDVVLEGKRHQYQHIDGELRSVGFPAVFIAGAQTEDATVFLNNVRLTGGQEYVDIDRNQHKGQGAAISLTEPHKGKAVFKDVTVHNWPSNAFYLSNREVRKLSRNVLWNCEAVNCVGGNMRVGFNATVVGGRSARDDTWVSEGLRGQCLDIQEGNNVEVIGLQIEASDHSNALKIRKDTTNVLLDRVTVHTYGPYVDADPVRFDPNASDNLHVELRTCTFYDESGVTVPLLEIEHSNENSETNVELTEGTRLLSESNAEIMVRDNASFEFDDTTYPDFGEYTWDQVGLEPLDPTDLPSYEFNYDNGGVCQISDL